MKKRILHIGVSKVFGGIETYLLNMTKNIDHSKYSIEFLVFFQEETDFIRLLKSYGGIIHRLPSRSDSYIKNRKELKAFFEKNNDISIIHNHVINLTYPYPVTYAPRKTKVILHSHIAKFPESKRIKFFHNFYQSKMIKRADRLIACSKGAGDFMYGEHPYEVLFNAIDFQNYEFDLEKRKKFKQELNFENKVVLGHVGRFEQQKNHKFLIEVFSDLVQEGNKDYHLLLIGEGTLFEETKYIVKEKNLENQVSFLGARNDVSDLLNVMDIFMLPSLYEGLPFVLVEAQVNGLKCIVSSEVSNESDVAKSIKYLNLNDTNEWISEIKKTDLQKVERNNVLKGTEYDISNAMQVLENMYRKLITNE